MGRPNAMSAARAPRGLPDPPLLVITDRLASRRPLPDVVAAVLAAGCRWMSVRERDLAPDRLVDLVASIVALAAPFGATVLVAGRADDVPDPLPGRRAPRACTCRATATPRTWRRCARRSVRPASSA
ncbi:MAG: hypothetical protein U0470_01160 [Anaerolineae bacterium]